VLVTPRLPWGRLLESAIFHVTVIVVLWSSSRLWPQSSNVVDPPAFHSSDVVYYEAPEYLPPLNTGQSPAPSPHRGDPEFAAQPILSVPPEPDNRSQTIVAPPNLKLDGDVPLPNIVALGHTAPSIPIAATSVSSPNRKALELPVDVVAPPPEVSRNQLNPALPLSQTVVAPAPEMNSVQSRRRPSPALQPTVVAPAPAIETSSTRRFGDINIAHSQVVAPAPQLPMDEQLARGNAARGGPSGSQTAVVPPPPSMAEAGAGKAGRLIALNLHPAAATGPVDPPAGNRRGTFAATPQGKHGASGTPDVAGSASLSAGNSAKAGAGNGAGSGKAVAGIPPGLMVGAAPKGNSGTGNSSGFPTNPRLLADAKLPSATSPRRSSSDNSPNEPSELERKVFGVRRLYTMTLNTPNLNSAGGSWVMHFAELNENPLDKSEVTAPVATQEVDPGYPIELMRQNVRGIVTLAAVIHDDGRVDEIHVLSGIDDRLDQYACAALARWRFVPGEKGGKPIALQAVIMIPFRPMRTKSDF
jgi:TonB family protein